MVNLRFRQIHLDFHTSEQIPGIGSEFDADEFADTLKAAHVNSVTCFARCHHGWIYYETERFAERRHPELCCDLLGQQIQACHARDIRVPVYITVQWDHYTAREHPEWLVCDENGCIPGTRPFEAGFYRRLCLNTPYVDWLEVMTSDVCEMLEVDGIFFDIVAASPCCCQYCIEGMIAQGLNPALSESRAQFADDVLVRFQERLSSVVHSLRPEATVFFNSGHLGPHHRRTIHTFTHLELESLPSGGWGYMHFPLAQRYARRLGRDTIGVTGKFHTSWGDFSSFKRPAALEFECLNMLALGAKCSIGDQLHPTGQVCGATYDLIGGVYAKVEAAEPWCEGAEPLVDIGVFTPEEFTGGRLHDAAIGATRILQETRHQFDIIDSQSDLSGYRLLVLPDEIPVSEDLAARVHGFVAAGGALLASYRSGLAPDGTDFALPDLGITLVGDAPYSPDFVVPAALADGLANTHHVMYRRGLEVELTDEAEVLSWVVRPYFNRTWQHFCSHRHTPAASPADYPAVVRKGSCVYFMHPVFSMYNANAPHWCKRLVANALDLLLPDPLLRAGGPSTALFTVNAQPAHHRLVVHVLHYIPERRGTDFDTIEDVIPIFDVPVSVRVGAPVTGVTLAPQGGVVPFTQSEGRVDFVIARVDGHQMVVLDVTAD